MPTPHEVASMMAMLVKRAGPANGAKLSYTVDPPDSPDGVWWIDISTGCRSIPLLPVSWSALKGFGIFSRPEQDVYGDRPDEIIADARRAAEAVAKVISDIRGGEIRDWHATAFKAISDGAVSVAHQVVKAGRIVLNKQKVRGD